MREQKEQNKKSPKNSKKTGSTTDRMRSSAGSNTSQIASLKGFFQRFGGKLSKRNQIKAKGKNSPLNQTQITNPAMNMTTAQSPRGQTARSGTFSNGQVTLRQQTDNGDHYGRAFENIDKAFAVLREDNGDDILNNTVDVGIHYGSTRPRTTMGNGSIDDLGDLTERSIPEMISSGGRPQQQISPHSKNVPQLNVQMLSST